MPRPKLVATRVVMEDYVEPAMAYYEEVLGRIAPYFFAPNLARLVGFQQLIVSRSYQIKRGDARTTKGVADTWWRNPWNFVRVLCVLSGLIGLAVGVYQQLHPEANLSVTFAIPVALFTASFSASMGMWLYSHITQASRDAQFRFERIYTPVYDDLLQVIGSLNDCRTAWLQKWRDIKDTSLKEFVAPEVNQALLDLERELEKYHQVWNEAYAAADRLLDEVRAGFPSRASPPNPGPEIANVFKAEYPFLFDPNITRLASHRVEDIANRLGQAGYHESKKLASDIAIKVKEDLLKNERVTARLQAVQSLMPKVEAVRKLVHQRLMRPLS